MEPGHRRHEKQGREEPAQFVTAQMTFLHVQREGVNGTLIAVVQRSESNLISSCELPKQLLVILREIRHGSARCFAFGSYSPLLEFENFFHKFCCCFRPEPAPVQTT